MSNRHSGKHHIAHGLTVGFALFATFFGAGNLIFPPLLGRLSGTQWWLAFLAFLLADAGLAVVAVLSVVRSEGTLEDQLAPLGKLPSRLLCVVLMLCVGPLVVIPRTCATTFELSIRPIFPDLNPWLFSIVFFLIVGGLTIKPTAVVDIIGKFLTPILLLLLFFLCIKGIISPIGSIIPPGENVSVIRMGIIDGYQTMDALIAIPLSIIIIKSVVQRGYSGSKEKFDVMARACLVAFVGLFLVYAGLCYLGATTSAMELGSLSATELLIHITELLLKRAGVIIVGVIVFLACLTTAIGVTSAVGDYLEHLFQGKLPYSTAVIMICAAGVFISNLGTTSIIELAEPVLSFIFPVFLTQIILSFFKQKIRKTWVFRGAAMGAALFTILDILHSYGVCSMPFLENIPLAGLGMGWILPALAGGLLAALWPSRPRE